MRCSASPAEQREQNPEARERLTRREREVLQAFGEGLSDPEITARLYISPGAVRTHMANILAKLAATGARLRRPPRHR